MKQNFGSIEQVSVVDTGLIICFHENYGENAFHSGQVRSRQKRSSLGLSIPKTKTTIRRI